MKRSYVLTIGMLGFMLAPLTQAAALSDIADSPNQTAIQYLSEKGIIGGYPDGTFRPQNTVNRAELLKILVGGKGAQPSPEQYSNCFPDVKNEWFAPFVCYAKQMGWIGGYSDGTFRPSSTVNSAEAIKMIVNAQGYSLPSSVTGLPYDDVDAGAWYAPFVMIAHEKGILEVEGGTLGVGADMKRGNLAESIYRAAIITEQALPRFVQSSSASSQSGAIVTARFPIDLMKNQEWMIRVETPRYFAYELAPIFTITRKGENFSVTAQHKDGKTGKMYDYIPLRYKDDYDLSISSTDTHYQDFSGFKTYQYLEAELSIDKYDYDEKTVLSIGRCDFQYIYSRENSVCDSFVLPTFLDAKTVKGYELQSANSWGIPKIISSGDFIVTVLRKSDVETECNVKSETVNKNLLDKGEKIYYVPSSKYFRNLTQFECFETEYDAKEAGYRKSAE